MEETINFLSSWSYTKLKMSQLKRGILQRLVNCIEIALNKWLKIIRYLFSIRICTWLYRLKMESKAYMVLDQAIYFKETKMDSLIRVLQHQTMEYSKEIQSILRMVAMAIKAIKIILILSTIKTLTIIMISII